MTVRYGICVPNLGQFADPRQAGELARRAEEAGWDGFFVWENVVFPYGDLAQDATGAIAAAGATWWLEGFRLQPGEQDAALRRIDAGPPR